MDIKEKSWKNPRKAASQFLNPASINLKKLPQMPASRFLKIVQETGQIPVCSFYLPVSSSRNPTVYRTNKHMYLCIYMRTSKEYTCFLLCIHIHINTFMYSNTHHSANMIKAFDSEISLFLSLPVQPATLNQEVANSHTKSSA